MKKKPRAAKGKNGTASKSGKGHSSSSSRPLAPSPARPLGPFAPGPGTWVVAYLRDPREKAFGMLLHMEAAGGWFRGIELGSFEDWAREIASGREAAMGLSTFFVPFLRVEKIVADEPVGVVPSLAQRFQVITGRSLEECLG